MAATTARVSTAKASRYLQQPCKPWAHRLDVTVTAAEGTVRSAQALAVLRAEHDGRVVTLEAAEPACSIK